MPNPIIPLGRRSQLVVSGGGSVADISNSVVGSSVKIYELSIPAPPPSVKNATFLTSLTASSLGAPQVITHNLGITAAGYIVQFWGTDGSPLAVNVTAFSANTISVWTPQAYANAKVVILSA